MQTMARKNEWPLDKMCLTVDVTKKTKEEYGHPPREGAYLHGLFMEGEPPRGAHVRCFGEGPFLLRFQYLPSLSIQPHECHLPHFLLFF